MLKLFSRQGILQHTSEYVAGVEKCIAWKPSGTVIASSQMLPNKHSIIFFEKNGLKHRDFALPFAPHTFALTQLAWSQDSEVLLVCGFEGSLDGGGEGGRYAQARQSLLLYTTSNYHWYLKQRLQFDLPLDTIGGILWDETEYSLLHLLSRQGGFTYRALHYNRSVSATAGQVLLIDGNQLLVSDFERSLVPPPMSTYGIEFEGQISQVCHEATDQENGGLLAVFLNGDQLVLLQQQSASSSLAECANVNDHHSIASYSFSNVFSDFTAVYRPLFSKVVPHIGRLLLPLLLGEQGRLYGLLDGRIACFDYQNPQSEGEIVFLSKELTEPIAALTTLPDRRQLLLANTAGRLFSFDIEKKSSAETEEENILTEYRPKTGATTPVYDDRPLHLWTFTDDDEKDGEPHIICHTVRNSLYYDHHLLFSCIVNSAMLYDGAGSSSSSKYLLFSTSSSLFYCWPLVKNFDPVQMFRAYPPRSLEKGARIIAASVGQAKVVLQMPRGNLEAFHPRLLVLSKVEQHLRELDFLRAFELLRKNRINLNYLCDFDFALFTANSDRFLQQIGEKHSDWICLFLSELSPENAFCLLNGKTEAEAPKIARKVDTVCELLREKMQVLMGGDDQQTQQERYLNALLLTYIKKEARPELAEALQVVKALPSGKLRDSAIKYMLYVVNVNRLFDEALGTYDFDILLMVAGRSNKDPKEYIPLVNGFKAIEEEEYRRYRIDMHLQRWRSALTHLSRCNDSDGSGGARFEEALELIEQRHLFREAIEIYGLNSSSSTEAAAKYSPIWNLYGDYLFKKKYYQEAAIAFRRAANHGQAFKMYLMEGNWSMASVCARQMARLEGKEDGEEEQEAAAFERHIGPVAQQLVLNGNHTAGAYIQEHYLHQPREAFTTLVRGRQWEQALRCLHDHFDRQVDVRKELLEGHLLPELKEAYQSTVGAIERTAGQLTGHLDRLKEVLMAARLNAQEAGAGAGGHHFETESDCYSDTSSLLDTASLKSSDSGHSASSLKTNKSRSAGFARKQKRLEQRKYVPVKRGSPNEDLQLVFAIRELLTSSSTSLLADSRALLLALYDLLLAEQSAALQRQLQQLHAQFTAALEYIWKGEFFERRLAEGRRTEHFAPFSVSHLIFCSFIDDMLREAPKLEQDPAKWSLVLNC